MEGWCGVVCGAGVVGVVDVVGMVGAVGVAGVVGAVGAVLLPGMLLVLPPSSATLAALTSSLLLAGMLLMLPRRKFCASVGCSRAATCSGAAHTSLASPVTPLTAL